MSMRCRTYEFRKTTFWDMPRGIFCIGKESKIPKGRRSLPSNISVIGSLQEWAGVGYLLHFYLARSLGLYITISSRCLSL